jgi:hypothetical protein
MFVFFTGLEAFFFFSWGFCLDMWDFCKDNEAFKRHFQRCEGFIELIWGFYKDSEAFWRFVREKKFRHSAVCPEKFDSPLLPFPFNLETSTFGFVNDLAPNRSFWFLDFGNKFRWVAPIRIFGSFFTFKQTHFQKLKKKTKKKWAFKESNPWPSVSELKLLP